MSVEIQSPRHVDFQKWTVDDWNDSLYLHFFASTQNGPKAPVVTLNVTPESLRESVGCDCTGAAAKAAFIEAIKRSIGSRSLAADAWRRSLGWNSTVDAVPPFLSHLFLTCMVANDLSEELQWSADLRVRLAQILGTQTQPLPRRLRSLWEEFAAWSVRQNIAGAGCRELRLPQIPDTGFHSIIGYSIRLAAPSRRDLTTLATLLRRNGLNGKEPEINAVLSLVNTNITRFSNDFREIFRGFIEAFKSKRFALLGQTAFWTSVRVVALAGSGELHVERTAPRVRLELEDDDGSFWLTLTSDRELCTDRVQTLVLPTARQSHYRFLLTDRIGRTLVNVLFSEKRADDETEKAISTIRSAISDGLLLFEETADRVFVLSTAFPSSGRLRALVSDSLRPALMDTIKSTDMTPDVRKSAFSGWSEWRGLSAEGLRVADLSKYPSLQAVQALRLTIAPPEIKFRGGIRHGTSFIAIKGALPAVEIPDAEQVSIELAAGQWQSLAAKDAAEDTWHFGPGLPVEQLLGSHRIVAFASSVPIAERIVSFVETTLSHDYKLPSDPERWLVESTSVDAVSFAEAANTVAPISTERTSPQDVHGRGIVMNPRGCSPGSSSESLVSLITIICSRLSAQRGLSEGELVEIMRGELGINPGKIWPVLRGWIEGGMLDALTDARWRVRVYFGRAPRLVVYRHRGYHEAVLTGLVPSYLLERFDALTIGPQLTNLTRHCVSPFVPSLPRCRANQIATLHELARELNLSGIGQLRTPEELSTDIRAAAAAFSSTTNDSWPFFRKWDWSSRTFNERPSVESVSGITLDWCRRDDGPDRYKIYKDGSLLWWSRSRTWAILASFTLADQPVFTVEPGGTMYSRGDSLYLPLPAARAVAWSGPMNPGPVTLRDGGSAYRYVFHDDRLRDSVLATMWPDKFRSAREISPLLAPVLGAVLRTGVGQRIPVPVSLKRAIDAIYDRSEFRSPATVPASVLPRLYALVASSRKGTP